MVVEEEEGVGHRDHSGSKRNRLRRRSNQCKDRGFHIAVAVVVVVVEGVEEPVGSMRGCHYGSTNT